MFAEERQSKIVQMVENGRSVKVLELAERFEVSESTIRRDLQELEEKNLLKRTHGGAVGVQRKSYEQSFQEKKEAHFTEKERIGELAASLLEDGDSVILDTGTTTLDIAEELSGIEGIELILTGGVLRGNTRAMVGTLAENMLRGFKADMAFIGANGITLEEGITTPNFVEAMTKKSMVSSATRVYAVLDASKFQQVSLAVIAPLKEITAVITAGDLEEELAALYESQGIEIRR